MSQTSLTGQGEEFVRLLEAAADLRIPHGLVIEGARGTGTSRAARSLAEALLCGRNLGADAAACVCCERVRTGNHPDLHLVELPEDKQDIPVDRIRELQEELERLPVEGRARVAILDPADRLNEQGQNALLKTLEEPGNETFLLLVTGRPEALLETVRSRTSRVRIRPLADEDLRVALGHRPTVPADYLNGVVERAGGSLGVALHLLEEQVRALDEAIAGFLVAPSVGSLGLVRETLHGAVGRTAVEARCRTFFGLLAGRLRVRLRRSLAEQGNQGYLPAAAMPLARAVDVVLQGHLDLESGIPPAQVLDAVLLGIVDVLDSGPK